MEHSIRNLLVNQKARITAITGTGETCRRLRDMGLIPGTEIKIVGRAPLKDPVALRLRDFTLTLRNNEADCVMVEAMEEGHE
ncbi:MAG: FeoA family protein [Pelovirga sp.]